MKKTICDRCRNEVSKHSSITNALVLPKYVVIRSNLDMFCVDEETIDLCDDCQKELHEWLKGKKEDE